MVAKSLTWDQVNAWRLSQHCLTQRLGPPDFIQAVTRTGGIQAQVMSAAEMAIGARVDGLSPKDVQSVLWQDRTLIKTWAMRGTLHLIPAGELPLYVAARSLYDTLNWTYYFEYYGINHSQLETYLAAAPDLLGAEPMSREQLAAVLAKETGVTELQSLILSKSWGTPFKPLADRGYLCFGPNNGRNVTFVNPRKWMGEWQPLEPYAALQEIARRYLRAYGPATVKEFAHWWAMGLIPAKKLFQSLEDELEAVDVEGWPALALKETIEPMQNSVTAGSVNLLPFFDAYVLGIGRGADIEPLLPKPYQRLVYRPQGWISAVVLVDGYIRGVWEYKNLRSQTIVKVRLFSPTSDLVWQGIEAEAERLGAFLNTKVVLEQS